MKKANHYKCDRAQKFWVGYLANMTPTKYCTEYCIYREGKLCRME